MISGPVLVVAATGDPLFSLAYTGRVFDRIVAPTKELLVFEVGRHLLFNECVELVTGPLVDRIRRLVAMSGRAGVAMPLTTWRRCGRAHGASVVREGLGRAGRATRLAPKGCRGGGRGWGPAGVVRLRPCSASAIPRAESSGVAGRGAIRVVMLVVAGGVPRPRSACHGGRRHGPQGNPR